MPPPMPNPSKRMTAQPSRPVARYRPGKPVAEEESSDEEDSEDEQEQKVQRRPAPRPQPTKPQAQVQQEEEADDDEEGFLTDPEDDDDDGGVDISAGKPTAKTVQTTTTAHVQSRPILEDQDSEDESEEESESESEADTSSSDDEPQRKFQRPTFIKKSERKLSATENGTPAIATSELPDDEDSHARRVAQTESLIEDRIKRDALARAAGKKAWDDDDEGFAAEELVDDTDGLDPEAEHQAWRLRELQRLKRDREAMIAREKEIEELERRRNLTAEERKKEDEVFLSKQKEERDEGRGQSGYLARYHHKGAFFQDDEAAEVLKKRDVMGAKFVDEVSDKSALPEFMRIRDMNKLGRKGRTRYKDLRNEDTGKWGDDVKRWRGAGDNRGREGGDMDMRGVDERFLPDRDRGGPSVSGANASAVGERRPRLRSRSRSRSPRRRDDEATYRPRRRSYSRSRSRSISPPRRKRSASPPRRRVEDEDERNKRRRLVDAV